MLRRAAARLLLLALAACSTSPPLLPPGPEPSQEPAASRAQSASATARPGGYYKDDGPGANPPDLDAVGDAQPKPERLLRAANNPYQVFGRDYVPLRSVGSLRQRGIASWYGRRYNGQKTSSGEIYDMYAMTAAHPTLPIPSYARVTNLANGRSVVVRINDRGPFLSDRVIDLSYVAAYKLGYVQAGSALVEVESLRPDGTFVAAAQRVQPKPEPAPVQSPQQSQPQPPPPPQMPVTSDSSGVYLQLGAFSMRNNAESFRVRVYKELPWLNDALQLSSQGGLFRLKLGPYPTQDDARRIAERIQTDLNLKPVLTVR